MIKKIFLGLVIVGLVALFVWAVIQLFKENDNILAEEDSQRKTETQDQSDEIAVVEEENEESVENREQNQEQSDESEVLIENDLTTENMAEETEENEEKEEISLETDSIRALEQDGLKIKVLKEGSGQQMVENSNKVTVHYVGKLINGRKFDSSIDRGKPFEFTVGQGEVIQGWEKGVLKMRIGEKRQLTIPAELGYGAMGAGRAVPPNATLIFEIELLSIK